MEFLRVSFQTQKYIFRTNKCNLLKVKILKTPLEVKLESLLSSLIYCVFKTKQERFFSRYTSANISHRGTFAYLKNNFFYYNRNKISQRRPKKKTANVLRISEIHYFCQSQLTKTVKYHKQEH